MRLDVFHRTPVVSYVEQVLLRVRPNYAINPTPELDLRSNRALQPARVIAALEFLGGPMAGKVHVALNWVTIDWMPDETWTKQVVPKLVDGGIDPKKIGRSVYVIRLNGNFAIDYEYNESPVVYIGEGNFSSRIAKHKEWVEEIRELVGDFQFQVCVATPRVKNSPEAYLDTEAALLLRFGELFGTAPLWNKQFEKRRNLNYLYSQAKLDYALRKRSGAKYSWAIRPMKSSIFHHAYEKTARIWEEKF